MGVIATALGWWGGPRPVHLSDATTADAALAETVRAAIADPSGYRGLAVAVVEGDAVRFAGLGDTATGGGAMDEHTAFEIGSIAKAMTGMLLADLAQDGTVHVDQPLRALLPEVEFDSASTGDITLAELASHRSGLPRIRITGVGQALGVYLRQLRGDDPYAGQDTDWLMSTVPGARRGESDPADYSNYGAAVLGHTLAAHTGTTYPALLQRRILDPLGMHRTSLHLDGAAPPADRASGSTAGGRPMRPWQASGYAPAGAGVWSTAADLAALVAAMLDGTAPGVDAATPRFDAGGDRRIGYGWFTDRVDGREITWHNGGTGGFRSFVGFDPSAGRGIVVLGNTDRDVDDLALALLTRSPRGDGGTDAIPIGITLFLSLIGAMALLLTTVLPNTDRLGLVSDTVWAVAFAAIAYRLGSWQAVPSLVWAIGVGLAAAAAGLAVRRWRGAPVYKGRYPVRRWIVTGASLLVAAVAVGWVYA